LKNQFAVKIENEISTKLLEVNITTLLFNKSQNTTTDYDSICIFDLRDWCTTGASRIFFDIYFNRKHNFQNIFSQLL